MSKNKIAIGVSRSFDTPVEEQIRLFKKVGFDGFFTEWGDEYNISECRKTADELGLEYQSIHAPFYGASSMWKNDISALSATNELLECLDDCARFSIPIMVVHPFIGFREHTPTNHGIESFKKVVQRAHELGITIAFENVEGEEYLDALMTAFADYDNVGFCYDSGHELCYNKGKDMLKKYGSRLVATHLNDNLGVSRSDGEIFWTDDLHLLPFDGIADWSNITKRLSDLEFSGFLTLELVKKSKPDRHENDKYQVMPMEEYLTKAYECACRIADMKSRHDADNSKK